MKKILFKSIEPMYVVMILRTFALSLVLILIYLFLVNWAENQFLIAPLGILISALLASYSVVLGVDTNIKLKNRELSNQIRYVFFHFCRIKMNLIALEQEKNRPMITYFDIDRILDTIQEINDMLSEVNNKEIVSILHNDVLTDLHFVYWEINSRSTHFKSMRKNLIRPEPQKENLPIYPNPLNVVSVKIDDSIEKLSRILTYLKTGYENEFPDNGGIEACAEYSPPNKEE